MQPTWLLRLTPHQLGVPSQSPKVDRAMSSEQAGGEQAYGPVLAAVATMQGNVPRSEKMQAHGFLEKFQKSV